MPDERCETCRCFDPREGYCAEWDLWMHKDKKCSSWQRSRIRRDPVEDLAQVSGEDDRRDAGNGGEKSGF